MALGGVSAEISSTGGRTGAGAQELSRQVVYAGVSAGGTAATLYKPSSIGAAIATLKAGPLLEAVANGFQAPGAPPPMALVLTQGAVGGKSSVSHTGPGSGTFAVTVAPHVPFIAKMTTAGTIATAAFAISYDGGTTYGTPVTTADSGGGSFVYAVPNTFCVLTFAAGTYVLNSTYTVGIDGTIARGGSAINTVTQASSPIDVYDVVVTVITGGSAGSCVVSVSPDGGESTLPYFAIPSGGVITVPGTGLVLTLTGTLTAGDTYSFVAHPPTITTSDITAAITAMRADATAPAACLIVLVGNPATPSGAFSAGSTLDTALATAYTTDGLDWRGRVNIPCSEGAISGDIIVSAGTAARATSSASSDIRTAREGQSFTRVGMSAGAHRVTSPLTGWKQQRTTAVILGRRYAETLPSQGVANREGDPLSVYKIGRNELTASTTMHDVQIDSLQTIRGEGGAWLAIQSGGFGFRHLTTDAAYQDADFMRIIDAVTAALRPVMQRLVGSRPRTNSDGAIHASEKRRIDALLQSTANRAAGLETGGAFNVPQLSALVVAVDSSSQIGTAPHELVVEGVAQSLGFVSNVRFRVRVTGAEV